MVVRPPHPVLRRAGPEDPLQGVPVHRVDAEFLGEPGGEKSHHLLHTVYHQK
ncbi:iron hydrogenase small subunit [uncultured Corynebacterium sp.]|uniref:iron hydrogenase small subunit n=1 Tax=uncultured Corynebacterium sp. TaxID=159447 RepID=UPI00345BA385